MQVCFISKYPPIEGFVSSYSYWLTKALGQRGYTIHVVTNAGEVDPQYKEVMHNHDTPNVVYYTTRADNRLGGIPIFNPFTEKLASLALDIVEKEDISLIDSWYLIPYGIAALIVNLISDLPLVGRVAGTDIERMCKSFQFNKLASSFFERCSHIYGNTRIISSLVAHENIHPHAIVLDPAFNKTAAPFDLTTTSYTEGTPVITFLGKAQRLKGFFPLVDALSGIDDPFLFLVVSNGGYYNQFAAHVKARSLEEKTVFLPFQPPWKMPSLYRASTAVVCLEHGHAIQRAPVIPREAALCGCCTIMSPEIHAKGYYKLLEKGVHTVVADPENIKELQKAVSDVIAHPERAETMGLNAHEFFSRLDNVHNHRKYIDSVIAMYKSMV